MTRFRGASLALCLAGTLSCSSLRTALTAPLPAPAPGGAASAVAAELARFQTGLNARERAEVAIAIVEEAERSRLSVDLILALMHTESAFHNFARSDAGALGLMQVMPATGEMLARQHGLEWRGPETLFDPVTNVRLGCRYLALLRARYGRMDIALAAYNWGPGAIDRRLAGGQTLPRRYPTRVLARLESQSAAASIGR